MIDGFNTAGFKGSGIDIQMIFERVFNELRAAKFRVFRDPSNKYKMLIDLDDIHVMGSLIGLGSNDEMNNQSIDTVILSFAVSAEVTMLDLKTIKTALVFDGMNNAKIVAMTMKYPDFSNGFDSAFESEDDENSGEGTYKPNSGTAGLLVMSYSLPVDENYSGADKQLENCLGCFHETTKYFCTGNKEFNLGFNVHYLSVDTNTRKTDGHITKSARVKDEENLLQGSCVGLSLDFGKAGNNPLSPMDLMTDNMELPDDVVIDSMDETKLKEEANKAFERAKEIGENRYKERNLKKIKKESSDIKGLSLD